MSKKAFVTGSTGFLGINLINKLLEKGWTVYALHRASSNLKHLSDPKINLVQGSITNLDSLRTAMPDQPDAVFHVAGNTSMWSKNNSEQYEDNVAGTENMVKCSMEKGARRFIQTSSIGAYGIHHHRIDETTPSNAASGPINYNRTKFLGEEAVKQAAKEGLSAIVINPAHIIGPYDDQNWAQLLMTVHNDDLPGIPGGKGSFCHVNDVVNAHIAAVDRGNVGENYLLGGEEARFIDVINMLQDMFAMKKSSNVTANWILKLGSVAFGIASVFTGKEPQVTPEKFELLTGTICCNFEKAQRDLGYQHRPMKESFSDSYAWLKKEGIL
ncbi:MAG: SDR family oxidoreductase [Flavobacteriales bacterium]|nr:SDR family oxidoreductase [Flavobacteriales bacterium]PCH89417.1 MAG: oxidoreductase [Flavobacteriales bacterium]